MEKIEQGYEIMSNFTVNLNREEKIIREIDFSRGVLRLWLSVSSCMCAKATGWAEWEMHKALRMDMQTSTGPQPLQWAAQSYQRTTQPAFACLFL